MMCFPEIPWCYIPKSQNFNKKKRIKKSLIYIFYDQIAFIFNG